MAQSFTAHFNYDVFMSFRGEDTRYNFTGHLNDAFRRRGINTFFDDQNLRVGNEIFPSLLEAIEQSRISVIVFSENYASSTWCLDELVKILDCMEQNKQWVWPIFYKVDPSDLRYQRNSYGQAIATHEIRFGKDSEKVRNWRSALTKVANLKGDHFRTGYEYESEFIDKIVKNVSAKLPFKGLYTEEHVVGLESRIEEMISLLDIPSHSIVCMLGIHGTGGIGKTTIAKVLYNSILHQFEYAAFLFDVRKNSNQYKGLVSLQEALLKMFEVEDVKLSSVDEGAFEIKKRLCYSKVLLVLDDVDNEEQLEKLVGNRNWFGSGSRIILTTRDKHLLLTHRVEKTYEMKELNDHEAFELFCWKAFNSSRPPEKFVVLSNEVVNYANGLPLALKVIGSNLCGKNLDECECALDQYKRIPNKKIQDILRISYDGLEEDNQKEIFLDIACFFRGNSLKDVKDILDACDFGTKYHIGVLIDKSLITIDEQECIRMHDLIQDMGREIVRMASPKKPEKRSRLWVNKDVIKVLQENSGTTNIEVILLDSYQQKIQWNGTAFKKMKNLRILIIRNARFLVCPKYLPDNLRVIEWEQCPLSTLPPSFDPKKLVILKMPQSCLKLEKSLGKFKYMTVMNFKSCQFVTEVPDISECSVLRKLDLKFCKNLIKVHDSVGFLTKLTHLDLSRCINLTRLPRALQMTSLEELRIDFCASLEHFPDILGAMDRLWLISASYTAIKELPNSIGNLTRLRKLVISWCKKLQEIHEIPSNLECIWAYGCTSLTLQLESLLWSQVIKRTSLKRITMSGPIPDWFDHRREGGVISFWAHGKLPDVAFVFMVNANIAPCLIDIFVNGVRGKKSLWTSKRYSVFSKYQMNPLEERDLERYLVHEWNYVEFKSRRPD